MNQKLKQWLMQENQDISIHNPLSIHLDFLEHTDDTVTGVQVYVDEYIEVAKWIKENEISGIPLLVFPLKVRGTKLTMEIPQNLDEFTRQLDIEPPSIYLLHVDIFRIPEVCEEYKSPLPFDLLPISPNEFYVFYREYRYSDALKKDWEYSRSIYLQPIPQINAPE